jgi:uncharacterized protein
MFQRDLQPPSKSFFLFGPRATGKSTWLEESFKDCYYINLLKSSEYLSLQKDPSLLSQRIYASKKKWIVIDEIQRLPELLNEVHAIIFESKKKINFALTGSSARKLKKLNANMLAGRAITKEFFAINTSEMKHQYELTKLLEYGMLPEVLNLKNDEGKIEYLMSYVETYLEQEIKQEAYVRNLATFQRFLSIAALLNGQKLNLSNIAREAGVARSTVSGYFSVLQDTLLGYVLEAYKPKVKIKEVSSPKFYFFDTGVARALSDKIYDSMDSTEKGLLLESFLLKEVKSYISYQGLGGKLYYWRTESGTEIDLLWKRGQKSIGIEVKSSKKWKSDFNKGLYTGLDSTLIKKAYGVYLGKEKLVQKNGDYIIEVYPVQQFLKELHEGRLLV